MSNEIRYRVTTEHGRETDRPDDGRPSVVAECPSCGGKVDTKFGIAAHSLGYRCWMSVPCDGCNKTYRIEQE